MKEEELAREIWNIDISRRLLLDREERASHAGGEFRILLCMYHIQKEILVGDIAKAFGLSFSRTTNVLNVLERKGYIHRRHDERDKRKVYVSLTEAGKAYIIQKHAEILEHYKTVAENLGEKDAMEYIRISHRIDEIYRKMRDRYSGTENRNEKGRMQRYV